MKNNLATMLKNHYQSQTLSKEKLERLLSVQKNNFDWRLSAAFGAAMAFCISLIIFNVFSPSLHEKIAREVSYNHKKKMPSEVLTKDYAQINLALDKLPFKVKKARKLDPKLSLVGARYCSIRGKIAAQVQLVHDSSKKPFTLYQFAAGGHKYQGLHSRSLIKDGVSVQIWVEGDLGFVLASDL